MTEEKRLTMPTDDLAKYDLHVGDKVLISGRILCGRDAVLPKVVKLIEENRLAEYGIDLKGTVIFHTAVSRAGVGPTSSNKLEIEGSFPALSKAGVKIHLGKGAIKPETVKMLAQEGAVYAIMPPVTALLESLTTDRRLVAFPELGMEALYELTVKDYPAIIAAANGEAIY